MLMVQIWHFSVRSSGPDATSPSDGNRPGGTFEIPSRSQIRPAKTSLLRRDVHAGRAPARKAARMRRRANVSKILSWLFTTRDLIQRGARHHFDQGHQFDTSNVQVGMPFPHEGDSLMQIGRRDLFYRRLTFPIRNAGELIQTGFAGAASPRPKSSLRLGCSLGTWFGHVRQHRLIYPTESKSKRADFNEIAT